MNNDVMAMIITYNPDIEALERNISGVVNQVGELVLMDNASTNVDKIQCLCDSYKVRLIKNASNLGVAQPLYDGVLLASQGGYKYILTLDDDSVACDNMVDNLKACFDLNDRVAAVGARTVDERVLLESNQHDATEEVDVLITSGMLARVDCILEVGNYITQMFIDAVDTEICWRLHEAKYKVMYCASAKLLHKRGYIVPKRLLTRTVYPNNYSCMRLYYQARNNKFCWLRYPNYGIKSKFLKYIRAEKLKILLFENQKIAKLKAISKGFKDADDFFKQVTKEKLDEK